MTERPLSMLALAAAQPAEPRDSPKLLIEVPLEGLVRVGLEARRYRDLVQLEQWLAASPTIRSQIHDALDALLDDLDEAAP